MPRLNTIQFTALRSIAREPWDMQMGRIQWRFNGTWNYLFRRGGVRAPLSSPDGMGGQCGHEEFFEEAHDAAMDLEGLGLVEEFTIRCCPGTPCHTNDHLAYRLTQKGANALQKANAVTPPVERKSPDPLPVAIKPAWWRKAVAALSLR
jgi:hypothetical protein